MYAVGRFSRDESEATRLRLRFRTERAAHQGAARSGPSAKGGRNRTESVSERAKATPGPTRHCPACDVGDINEVRLSGVRLPSGERCNRNWNIRDVQVRP